MRTFAVACAALALALFVAGAFAVWDGEWGAVRHAHGSELVNDIKAAEGFRGNPYRDSRGFDTLGYGTRLPITKAEGEILLRHRLDGMTRCVAVRWPPWKAASAAVRDALSNAAYNLGCEGLLGFGNALSALARRDYAAAAQAFRENEEGDGPSVWFSEDPRRVEAVIARLPK